MNTVTNSAAVEAASAISATLAPVTPMGRSSAPAAGSLRLVEEAAALEHAGTFLGRDLDVVRRQQENAVGDPLHAPVQRVGEAAGEIDQPLGQLLVGVLEVDDHGHAVLEPVGDLLGVVEAARQDEMHLRARRR